MYHGMGGSCAETAHIGARGIFISGYLSRCLGKVSPAPLVHVPAGFLAAVNHIFHIIGIEPVLKLQFNQGEDVGRLGHQVFQHHMGGQVHIHIMGALYNACQFFPVDIKPLGMLFPYKAFQFFPWPVILKKPFQLLLCEHAALFQLILHSPREPFLQHDQFEHITDVHDPVKFIFREYAAKRTFFLWLIPLFIIIWERCFPQFLMGRIPYVNLVWDIGKHVLIFPQVFRQFHQIPGVRVHNPLGCLRGAVIYNHIRGGSQCIAGPLNNRITFHSVSPPIFMNNLCTDRPVPSLTPV